MDFQLSLESESVGSAYPDQPLATTPETSVDEVLQLLRAQRSGAVVVCEHGKLVGVFTERDALKLMAKGADCSLPIGDFMSRNPVTLAADASVGEAIRTMSAGRYRHLPIVDEQGQPTGVTAVHGIVHYLVDHFPSTVYNLPPEPNPTQSEREGA